MPPILTSNHDLSLLHPVFREKAQKLLERLAQERLPFRIYEAFRSPQRQAYLYAQGRTRPGKIVTKAKPWQSYHQYGVAADFVLFIDGQWSWDTTGIHAGWWKRLHVLGAELGLERLSFETPHLQLSGLTWEGLQEGNFPEGGDKGWAENLEAHIISWSGTPAAPPVPTVYPQRPGLPNTPFEIEATPGSAVVPAQPAEVEVKEELVVQLAPKPVSLPSAPEEEEVEPVSDSTQLDFSKMYLNGIDATTGQYLVQPVDLQQVSDSIKGKSEPNRFVSWLSQWWQTKLKRHLGLRPDLHEDRVEEAGWGIVFHQDEIPEIREALQPLIEHRRKQIGNDEIVKVLEYHGEDRAGWLAFYEVSAGNIDPTKVPYYLLLVGSPEKIPFMFGYHLDVEYGVGRLHLDTPEEYASYVRHLIAYETGQTVSNSKEAVFFGTRHLGDQPTNLSADYLVKPLADGHPAKGEMNIATKNGFRSRKLLAGRATKQALTELFPADPAIPVPSFLFTATHGMGLAKGHPNQLSDQGALLCQNWPGLGSISPEHYYRAQDFRDARRYCQGMVAFNFACYGLGTPKENRFHYRADLPPGDRAEAPFFAALPKIMLANGALACIGHIERAWGCSFKPQDIGPQIGPFKNTIELILLGKPVGFALREFNLRYASLSTELLTTQEQINDGARFDPNKLISNWVERNDAESYAILGDPAVKLRVADLR